MPIYDLGVVKDSTLHQKDIRFHIPDGRQTREKDWYPYMLHHNGSEAFSQYIGKNVSLDILYSFGHFDFWKGSSSFYDLDSPYCGAFYGGYAVFPQDPQWRYGFDQNGFPSIDELSKVPIFDQLHLVLPSVGLTADQGVFRYQTKDIQFHQSYIGYTDWVKVDADIQTNAPIHQRDHADFPGYYQYGFPYPAWFRDVSYPVINLKGRTYARYFEEYNGTFFLYIMATNEDTLEKCDQQLLSASSISYKK
ncbi:hypothetical protein [Anaerosolibacter sp.]|uniref:hypothetical protein n=1 Tax=Anaerosolibacter sp. TaxID=1872527 RepID=UPI0039EFEA2B